MAELAATEFLGPADKKLAETELESPVAWRRHMVASSDAAHFTGLPHTLRRLPKISVLLDGQASEAIRRRFAVRWCLMLHVERLSPVRTLDIRCQTTTAGVPCRSANIRLLVNC